MSSPSRRPLLPSAAVALLALAGCAPGGANATVAVPHPSSATAKLCRALHEALPRTVDGQSRHTVHPVSDLTTAWGSPAIVLRCGVAAPDVLTPGDPHYDPTADSVEIDGVDWLPQKLDDGGVRCTTTLRRAYVEVTIPRRYAGEYGDLGSLTDLAAAVSRTVPAGLG